MREETGHHGHPGPVETRVSERDRHGPGAQAGQQAPADHREDQDAVRVHDVVHEVGAQDGLVRGHVLVRRVQNMQAKGARARQALLPELRVQKGHLRHVRRAHFEHQSLQTVGHVKEIRNNVDTDDTTNTIDAKRFKIIRYTPGLVLYFFDLIVI